MVEEAIRLIQPVRIGRRRALELLVGGGLGLGSLLLAGRADAHEYMDFLSSVEELRTKVWQNPRPVIVIFGDRGEHLNIVNPYTGGPMGVLDTSTSRALHDISHRYEGKVEFYRFDTDKIASAISHRQGILGTPDTFQAEFREALGFSGEHSGQMTAMYAPFDVATGERFDRNQIIDSIDNNEIPWAHRAEYPLVFKVEYLEKWVKTNLLPPTRDYAIRHRIDHQASSPSPRNKRYLVGIKLKVEDLSPPKRTEEKTVDDILRWTQFKNLDVDDYEAAVQDGNKLVFVYDDTNSSSAVRQASINLAKVLRSVHDKYRGSVWFLKYKDEGSEQAKAIIGSGYSGVPTYFLFQDGEEAFKREGGPRNDKEISDWTAAIGRRIEKARDGAGYIFDPRRPPSRH